MGSQAAPAPRWPLLLLRALLLLRSTADAWELTILHTNDVHSRLEQTSEHSTKCFNASLCVGGVARLFTKVQQIRREEPNVLLLDAGDQYQGTIWFTVYKGLEVAHFMNILRYDAMILTGNAKTAGIPSAFSDTSLGKLPVPCLLSPQQFLSCSTGELKQHISEALHISKKEVPWNCLIQ